MKRKERVFLQTCLLYLVILLTMLDNMSTWFLNTTEGMFITFLIYGAGVTIIDEMFDIFQTKRNDNEE